MTQGHRAWKRGLSAYLQYDLSAYKAGLRCNSTLLLTVCGASYMEVLYGAELMTMPSLMTMRSISVINTSFTKMYDIN
jgi:hypothetical protein